ncbi:sigma 54-interacting transcriptional regulator [Pyxidicoccus xibeiensis]|uniref:sigma 54-interacting transcriptional regulator n=1 Tax=Pyxidicoccus xibeiensis TaxID=2906759 RepID=UPI0020A76413|nr:sigma-54 dependent transcriptional regulator [Pyxidicoccus xibeiensis]MCP3142805.1 sigma-54 dependent transcriptional regulator [Pyxidicoccus xibeiensis]
MQPVPDDESTANVPPPDADAPGSRPVPALTLVSHPMVHRVGERLLLDALLQGREVALSRNAPLFTRPGAALGLPLADPFLSRKALRLGPGVRGGVRLEVEEGGTRVVAGGIPGERWDFGPEALAAGVPLELAGRVVVLLHLVDASEPDSPDTLGMVGQSAALGRVRVRVAQVADLDVPVLIRGETGTGKELVARALHQRSPRRQGPFVSVNLGTLPRELAAAELFGAQRGAYTGATQAREGFFRAAHGGTLFLDEVGEASPEVQVLLLRVLETGELFPVGASTPVATNVRLVTATDAPLEELIQQGRFRAPLLHRLAGYEIRLPPLRQRREDISLLFHHFARQELEVLGEARRLVTEDPHAEPWLPAPLASLLLRHTWPGNIRQLRNVARQLVITSRGQPRLKMDPQLEQELGPVTAPAAEVATPQPEGAEPSPPPRRKPSEVSEEELVGALRACAWDLKATAGRLGITRASLYNLIDRSTRIRTVRDLGTEEIRRCFQECGGDLDAMVRRLEVSGRALQRRIRELGLGTEEE